MILKIKDFICSNNLIFLYIKIILFNYINLKIKIILLFFQKNSIVKLNIFFYFSNGWNNILCRISMFNFKYFIIIIYFYTLYKIMLYGKIRKKE